MQTKFLLPCTPIDISFIVFVISAYIFHSVSKSDIVLKPLLTCIHLREQTHDCSLLRTKRFMWWKCLSEILFFHMLLSSKLSKFWSMVFDGEIILRKYLSVCHLANIPVWITSGNMAILDENLSWKHLQFIFNRLQALKGMVWMYW